VGAGESQVIESIRGRYVIHHDGIECGEERWSIERDEHGEVATGEQETRPPFPFPSTLEWRATLSSEGRLGGIELRWRVGERLVQATHAGEGATWRVRIEAQGHVREQEGDYPPRAHVVLGAHAFHTFVFRTLVLEPGAEHEVPMLAVGPPWMAVDPSRLLLRCTEARVLATPMGPRPARRIEVLDPNRGRAEAFAAWIDEHDVVLASYEGDGDARPWMLLAEYVRETR
jgi:hypothetical protein